MSLEAILTQLLMGLTVGVNLVLVATGLTLVFGMMGVINFAHSALFMLGAYAALMVSAAWAASGSGPGRAARDRVCSARGGALAPAPAARAYPALPSAPAPLTPPFGLSLFFEGSAKAIWGADILSLSTSRRLLGGRVSLGRITFPTYWLFALVAATVLAAAVGSSSSGPRSACRSARPPRTRTMAAVLGVNVERLNTIVFGLGSGLAGAAGVILGTMTSLSPQMGAGIVLDAFIAIVIGGLGSFTGAIVGSLLLGQVQSFGVALLPAFHTPLIFLVMAVVLVLRPSGLFGAAERR